jgi:hypothetical protein
VLTLCFILWSFFSVTMTSDGSKTRRIYFTRIIIGASMGAIFPTFHCVLAQVILIECTHDIRSRQTGLVNFLTCKYVL